jgi:uncharacterized protein YkwD
MLKNQKSTDKPAANSLKSNQFSRRGVLYFAVVFCLVGLFLIIRSYAATPLVANLQAERMSLPAGANVVSDASASGGQAVMLTSNGTLSGSVSLPSNSASLNLVVKGSNCSTSRTLFSLTIDNSSVLSGSVSGTSWRSSAATRNLQAGLHNVSVNFSLSSSGGVTRGGPCSPSAYLDVINFYGQSTGTTPAPAVSLGATPTSVSPGQSATLTWNSTNATSCTASGAWSGNRPLQGSASTGALNATSRYTLTCSGPGGSSAASTTVSVNSTQPPPPPPTTGSNCTPGSDWGTTRSDYAAQVLTLVNQHRASLGLGQLSTSSTLTASATWKSLHMAKYNYFSHDDPAPPVARSVAQRITDCGYHGNGWGENIAWGYTTPQDVMNAWLNSAGHKANIENPNFHVIGIGVAVSSGGKFYWTQDFGYQADSQLGNIQAGTPTPSGSGVN